MQVDCVLLTWYKVYGKKKRTDATVKCISLKSDFITVFHDFIHVYSPRAGADNPLGMTFLCQHEHFVTLIVCCKFKKISLKSDF